MTQKPEQWELDHPDRVWVDHLGKKHLLAVFPGYLLEAKLQKFPLHLRPLILQRLERRARRDGDLEIMRALKEYRELCLLPAPAPHEWYPPGWLLKAEDRYMDLLTEAVQRVIAEKQKNQVPKP